MSKPNVRVLSRETAGEIAETVGIIYEQLDVLTRLLNDASFHDGAMKARKLIEEVNGIGGVAFAFGLLYAHDQQTKPAEREKEGDGCTDAEDATFLRDTERPALMADRSALAAVIDRLLCDDPDVYLAAINAIESCGRTKDQIETWAQEATDGDS